MSRPLLPLSGFRTFESAARHLSFARAAEELRVTPAAVSHQMRTLEDYLGVRLFRREAKRLSLTDAGEALLPDLRVAFERLESALDRVRPEPQRQTLAITMPPSFASKWCVPRLDKFRSAHPDVELRLDVNDRVVDFGAAGVDVAVRYGMGDYIGLVSEKLCDETVFPVCSPRIAARLSHPRDLAQEQLIHTDANARLDPTFPTWLTWLTAAGAGQVDADRGMRFTLSTPAIEAAIDGQGVVLGRSLVVAEDLAAGRLVQPFDLKLPVRPAYYLVYPKAALRRRNVERLRAWILAEFARAPVTPITDAMGFKELAVLGDAG